MVEVELERVVQKKSLEYTISVVVLNKIGKKLYDTLILGKSMCDWVVSAVGSMPHKVIDFDSKLDSRDIVRANIDESDYTLVLYSTTPLLTMGVINHIIEYVTVRESSATKLPLGYMVRTDYLRNSKEIMFDSVYNYNLDYFYEVDDKKHVTYVTKLLSSKINTFYLNHGVEIENIDTVLIEPSVRISKDVTILGHNTIKGDTIIESGAVLKEKNVIEDSSIGRGVLVSNSNIKNSTLEANSCIGSYCEIIDSVIREDVVVNRYSSITGRTIRRGTVVSERSTLEKGAKGKKC